MREVKRAISSGAATTTKVVVACSAAIRPFRRSRVGAAGRSSAVDDMSATSTLRSPLRRRHGRTTVGTPDPNEVSWTGKQIATVAQCSRCDFRCDVAD